MIICPRCKRDTGAKPDEHECINNGRRIFLLGALAAPLVKPAPLISAPKRITVEYGSNQRSHASWMKVIDSRTGQATTVYVVRWNASFHTWEMAT